MTSRKMLTNLISYRLFILTICFNNFQSTWKDPHLKWKPLEFGGIKEIVISAKNIWLPDIALYNSDHQFRPLKLSVVRPTVYYDGDVSGSIPIMPKTTCKVNVEDYPMDTQKCNMVFGSLTHHSIEIRIKSLKKKFDLKSYIINGQWKIIGTSLEEKLAPLHNSSENFYQVVFTLNLRRRVLYYMMYLIIPGTLIALLASIIFVLPQDCSERITVGMAILVALSFFFLLVSENMPATGSISAIAGYYAVTMVQMAISFFLNVLILRFHHMTEEKVPNWIKKYILHHGAKLLRMKFRPKNDGKENLKGRIKWSGLMERFCSKMVKKKTKRNLDEITILNNFDKPIKHFFETKREMAARDEEWKKAAEVLNNFSLIFHILGVTLTFGLLFLEYLFT
ncbi:neuronal acetylcholine receptor subunit alpha-10-like [Dendronephthya gigantea]|uniref:neuronal acetylcholine receptor subunit alpha-10-like n=1 Tax=Dendronephthya gigantea TaxID=151771 RepID=UPI00106C00DC|nr:neuronal acetylcholine receptor subunit alpha-10-like [Dendronephthya gigantea]